MRGDNELRCLNNVKHLVFYKNGKLMQNPFTHKTYLDVSDDEFNKDRNWYVNSECFRSYFGLLKNDRDEFETILRVAKPNSDLSCFPDFKFKNGFIEHFQITSSIVTRKGAEQVKKAKEFYRKVDNDTKKIEKEWNEEPSFDLVRSKTWNFTNPMHSYSNLADSFKRNWEHHIESYGKYTGSKQIRIFLIEYPEIALAMCENVYHDWIDGMSHGDMRKQEEFTEYRLSRDANLLQYICQFKEKIHYVIFLNHKRIEVIRTENIPYLIKLLPWDYYIYPLTVNTSTSIYNISVPITPQQDVEIDDNN